MRMLVAATIALAAVACSPKQAPAPAQPAAPEITGDDGDYGGDPGTPSGPRAVDRAVAGQDFRITVTEDRNAGKFNLHLTSLNTERDLCVGAAEWPDERGRLEGAADYVSLSANGQGYAMRDSGEAACGQACVRHIAPGASLDGFIGFDQFQLDAFDGPGPRTLNFGLEPYFCDSGEVQ